jgi:adenine-specific DNA methylase
MGKSNSLTRKKENGIYYTPEVLANFLVDSLIKSDGLSVFDPAYGGGALLLAAKAKMKESSYRIDNSSLFGCDKHPVNGLLGSLPKSNLVEIDFFSFSTDNKYDVVLTNPPYVRQQIQAKEQIEAYRANNPNLDGLHNRADLWAYFLVKSIDHLKKGGSLGAILPWSFIQADYAKPIRANLLNKFENIRLLALKNKYFAGVDERILIVWLNNYGESNTKIEFAYSKEVKRNISFIDLSRESWVSNTILPEKGNSLKFVFDQLSKVYGFKSFNNYASSLIGIVTGANKFFIKDYDEAISLGFKEDQLIPIMTKTEDLAAYLKDKKNITKGLIYLTSKDEKKHYEYIHSGEEQDFHLRAHSTLREPWYSVKLGNVPDAFFPYRMSRIPHLVLNDSDMQSTNSIHRIYFKELTKVEIRWIFVSMLSVYGQLSLEANSKTYGRGILKVEPGSLGNVLVTKRKDNSINWFYKKIINRLKVGKKDEAVKIATNFINEKLEIPIEFSSIAFVVWQKIEFNRRN